MTKRHRFLFLAVFAAFLLFSTLHFLDRTEPFGEKGKTYVVSQLPNRRDPDGFIGRFPYTSVTKAEALAAIKSRFKIELPDRAVFPGAILQVWGEPLGGARSPAVPIQNRKPSPAAAVFFFSDPKKLNDPNYLSADIYFRVAEEGASLQRGQVSFNCSVAASYCYGSILCLDLLQIAKENEPEKLEMWTRSEPLYSSRLSAAYPDKCRKSATP